MDTIACRAFFPAGIWNNSADAIGLDTVDEFVFGIIQAPKTGTIKKVGVQIRSSTIPVGAEFRVSLEEVSTTVGQPVATTRAGATLFDTGSESDAIAYSAAGPVWAAINGTTGTAVTKGDLIAIVVRLTAITSGTLTMTLDRYRRWQALPMTESGGNIYGGFYTDSAWTLSGVGNFGLEYDGEIVPCLSLAPLLGSTTGIDTNSFYSTAAYDRYGMKFTAPFGCVVSGVLVRVDLDADAELIVYDSDEYTELASVALDSDQRKNTSAGLFYIELPSPVTFEKDETYRVVLQATTSSQISIYNAVIPSDGSLDGRAMYGGGECISSTQRSGDPTSGSHAWTDDDTEQPAMVVMIVEIQFHTPEEIAEAVWTREGRSLTS